jgi:hypothetical protein
MGMDCANYLLWNVVDCCDSENWKLDPPGDNTAVSQPCYRRTYGCIIPRRRSVCMQVKGSNLHCTQRSSCLSCFLILCWQMYSCGSLAPKMGRGGGCMDHKFRKPSEPWELADGYDYVTLSFWIQWPNRYKSSEVKFKSRLLRYSNQLSLFDCDVYVKISVLKTCQEKTSTEKICEIKRKLDCVISSVFAVFFCILKWKLFCRLKVEDLWRL